MNMFVKSVAVLGVTGAMALAAMSPSEARSGRTWAAAGVGFAAGAMVGAAAANANRGYYYDDYGYAHARGPVYYDTAPSYTYSAPAYGYEVDSYAYAPAPRYYNRRGMNNAREQQLRSSDY